VGDEGRPHAETVLGRKTARGNVQGMVGEQNLRTTGEFQTKAVFLKSLALFAEIGAEVGFSPCRDVQQEHQKDGELLHWAVSTF
jgi:hypothetical protein